MSRTFAEVLILVPTVLEAGLLMFIAEAIQKIMNGMEPAEFKRFLAALEYRATRSSTAFSVAIITTIASIIYWIAFGFDHWWFTAGLIMWWVAGTCSKIFNLPIYRKVKKLDENQTEELINERRKLQTANYVRAYLTFVCVVLMVIALA